MTTITSPGRIAAVPRQPEQLPEWKRARQVAGVARCRECKAIARVEGYRITQRRMTRFGDGGWAFLEHLWPRLSCSCSTTAWVSVEPIKATVNPGTRCDARCTNAKGHSCDCSCGGANHGKAYAI